MVWNSCFSKGCGFCFVCETFSSHNDLTFFTCSSYEVLHPPCVLPWMQVCASKARAGLRRDLRRPFRGLLGGFSARRISPRWLRLRAGLSRLARMGKFVAWVRRLSCFAGTPKRWLCGVVGHGRRRRGAAGLQDLLPVGYNDLASTRAATLGRSLTDAIGGTGAAAGTSRSAFGWSRSTYTTTRQSPQGVTLDPRNRCNLQRCKGRKLSRGKTTTVSATSSAFGGADV